LEPDLLDSILIAILKLAAFIGLESESMTGG